MWLLILKKLLIHSGILLTFEKKIIFKWIKEYCLCCFYIYNILILIKNMLTIIYFYSNVLLNLLGILKVLKQK